METRHAQDLGDIVGTCLPYLRRYARALTGSQDSGDHYAATTIEAIISDQSVFDLGISPKVALFKVFSSISPKSLTKGIPPDFITSSAAPIPDLPAPSIETFLFLRS